MHLKYATAVLSANGYVKSNVAEALKTEKRHKASHQTNISLLLSNLSAALVNPYL